MEVTSFHGISVTAPNKFRRAILRSSIIIHSLDDKVKSNPIIPEKEAKMIPKTKSLIMRKIISTINVIAVNNKKTPIKTLKNVAGR